MRSLRAARRRAARPGRCSCWSRSSTSGPARTWLASASASWWWRARDGSQPSTRAAQAAAPGQRGRLPRARRGCGAGTPWVLLGGGAEEEALARAAGGGVRGGRVRLHRRPHAVGRRPGARPDRAGARPAGAGGAAGADLRAGPAPGHAVAAARGRLRDAAARPVRRQRLISADGRREPAAPAGDAAVIGEPFLDAGRCAARRRARPACRRRRCAAARPARSAATPRPGPTRRRRSGSPRAARRRDRRTRRARGSRCAPRGRGSAPSRASPSPARRARSSSSARCAAGRAGAPCAPRATSTRAPSPRRRRRGRR